jgi:hypothetical protein
VSTAGFFVFLEMCLAGLIFVLLQYAGPDEPTGLLPEYPKQGYATGGIG